MQRFVRLAGAAGLLLALACSGSDRPLAPTSVDVPTMVVRIVAGDRQQGVEGDTLQPIVALVTNRDGVPEPGVAVTWKVNDNGVIRPLSSVTGPDGRVEALWTLGREDDHDGVARVQEGSAGAFTAADLDARTLGLLEVGVLRPRTYEGSGQTVHPDFVRTPDDWGAYSQHLAITPYPNGSSATENPSLLVSRSGYRWFPQPGVPNPLVAPGSGGYLSDPDIVYVPPMRELRMYYRQVDSRNRILMVHSTNGSDWTTPVAVVDAPNHQLISPAVVRRDASTWYMWSVNSGSGGCSSVATTVQLRRSRDGLTWGLPVTLDLKNGELTPWHIEVQWIPALNQYWALYPAKRPGTCATRALYLATSADGVKWTTYPTPVLRAGELPELNDIVYRSTFEYDEQTDEVRFWFSGANEIGLSLYNWRTVLQRHTRSELFLKISTPESPLVVHSTRALPVLINPP